MTVCLPIGVLNRTLHLDHTFILVILECLLRSIIKIGEINTFPHTIQYSKDVEHIVYRYLPS